MVKQGLVGFNTVDDDNISTLDNFILYILPTFDLCFCYIFLRPGGSFFIHL